MQNDIAKHIREWVGVVSENQQSLGGHSICPFAKTAKYNIVKITDFNSFVPSCSSAELVLYVLPESYTVSEVEQFACHSNLQFPEFLFIPDPKEKQTFIKNIQTNNGKYNLVFCQPRSKMSTARQYLKRIGYYENWTTEQLQNILKEEHPTFISKCPYTKTKTRVKQAITSIISSVNRCLFIGTNG